MRLVTRDAHELAMNRPSPLDVDGDEALYVALAEGGDPRAAMALFHRAGTCELRIDAGVPSLIAGDRQAADRWLEMAARHGDCEAMAQYARSMQQRLSDARERDTLTPDDIAAIGARALGFLETAVQRGYRDAFTLLADALETGRFGRIDAVASLAYRLALNRLDGDAFTRRSVRRAERPLASVDRERASAAASVVVRTVKSHVARERRRG